MTARATTTTLPERAISDALAEGPFRLLPTLKHRVWGGTRLGGTAGDPVGEAWVVHGGGEVADGPFAGWTLDQVTAEAGEILLGRKNAAAGFPLTIKLLDSRDWLSVQVHPDDALASELEGPGACGKTEAWFVLEAEPGAEIITGPRDGVSREAFDKALASGCLTDTLHAEPTSAGDAVLVPAGTVHAMGPGIFAYEVQQASNITYRGYDWERGRSLDIDEFRRATNPAGRAELRREAPRGQVFATKPFVLEYHPGVLPTMAAGTLRVVTVIGGDGRLQADGWSVELVAEETVVVPAAAGPFGGEATGGFLVATQGQQ